MTALVQPGSLAWLVWHDVRVKARGRPGRWGRIIALLLLAILPVAGGRWRHGVRAACPCCRSARWAWWARRCSSCCW